MKNIISLIALIIGSQAFASGHVGTSSLKVKLYSLSLSTSVLCTNPTVVYSNANPSYQDWVTNPTLFSGDISVSGSFPCLILEVSDNWKVTPTANDGTRCVSGVETTYDICQTGISTDKPDGTTVACTTGEDHIWIYMSTAATGNPDTILGVFQRPTSNPDTQHGYNLANAFQVAGSVTSTLTIANVLSTSLSDDGTACALQNSPHFLFN